MVPTAINSREDSHGETLEGGEAEERVSKRRVRMRRSQLAQQQQKRRGAVNKRKSYSSYYSVARAFGVIVGGDVVDRARAVDCCLQILIVLVKLDPCL